MQKSPYSLYKSCRQWSIESIYEFSAESSHAFSRKSPKTSKNLIFWHKRAQKNFFGVFGENRASSLFYTWNRLTCCKKSEKSNDGKYENFCHGQTDGQTDGPGYIGPEGGSKNLFTKVVDNGLMRFWENFKKLHFLQRYRKNS